MNLLVIGAAGRTGRHLVEQAARRGHTVTALARREPGDPAFGGAARAHPGDAADPEALRGALQGQHAVVAAVGSSAITRALIPAMRQAGVRRLVMTSSRSVVATRPRPLIDLVWLRLRTAYADLIRAEGMLEASGLDWSIVRATMLTDTPPAGSVHTDFEADATGGDWRLGRADYAMALLDVVEDDAMIRRAVGVCGARVRSSRSGSR
ncbi:NAD(P)-dependent oxidoreductase [Nocardiopsis composta]|uniref:Putative NADH-flavin reductase n=1 Tax=Nocardiopsis composta TaxID=157465 RepID=A0A7W8QIS4_9ACTN|nr:NAD(P)H-binding protein [Nocardiopsis composta]MBB5430266.1 putative NADH-flavin reductase [Nocardiopsis composta]